jgi:hypothetical protein
MPIFFSTRCTRTSSVDDDDDVVGCYHMLQLKILLVLMKLFYFTTIYNFLDFCVLDRHDFARFCSNNNEILFNCLMLFYTALSCFKKTYLIHRNEIVHIRTYKYTPLSLSPSLF